MQASVAVVHRPQSTGSVAVPQSLVTLRHAEAGPEIEPMSLVLAGEFFTTGSPGKSCKIHFNYCIVQCQKEFRVRKITAETFTRISWF